jgi:CHAD domain-containing protein
MPGSFCKNGGITTTLQDLRMAEGKWIEHLKADTPLPEAARKALLARMQAVRHWLPQALEEADPDHEHVHQLRVATRRADAALRIFEPCLPDKIARKTRTRLRRIRRAAGTARDLDVFALDLLERSKKSAQRDRPGVDFLLGHTVGQRTLAQQQLHQVGSQEGHDFDEFLRDLILAVRQPPDAADDATLVVLARPMLANLLTALRERASADLTEYANLHQVRIAGKRLRYAMEVFAPCFDPPFRQTSYPLVEHMQEILGDANDRHNGMQRIEAIRVFLRSVWPAAWKRLAPGIDATLQSHRKRLPVERRRFLRWWKDWQAWGEPTLLEYLNAADT